MKLAIIIIIGVSVFIGIGLEILTRTTNKINKILNLDPREYKLDTKSVGIMAQDIIDKSDTKKK